MWMVFGIIVSGAIIAWIESPDLVRRRLVKELVIFYVILGLGVTVSLLEALQFELPNPLDWVNALHKPFSDFVFRTLK